MSYEAALDDAILAHVDANDLGDLATRLGEVFPTNLRNRVVALYHDGRLADLHLAIISDTTSTYKSNEDGLPVPHPLDGDWRLSVNSRELMAMRLLSSASPGQVLLLGVPTVHHRMQGEIENITLIDANPLLSRALRAENVLPLDITLVEPLLRDVQCVFADPPWYADKLHHFVWFASACMANNGILYLSVPGVLTRPSINQERVDLLDLANQCGLECLCIEPHALRYESPPFERATLAAAGFAQFPQAWRTGDLMTFRKRNDTLAPRPARVPTATWRQLIIDHVDIRFRVRASDAFDPTPQCVATSSVRLDVTSRDPVLTSVDVWTSGNQIYSSRNPALLADLAELLNKNAVGNQMIESRIGRTLSRHELECVQLAIAELERIIFIDSTRRRVPRPAYPPGSTIVTEIDPRISRCV